jgi:hypothetical protein
VGGADRCRWCQFSCGSQNSERQHYSRPFVAPGFVLSMANRSGCSFMGYAKHKWLTICCLGFFKATLMFKCLQLVFYTSCSLSDTVLLPLKGQAGALLDYTFAGSWNFF